jgi:hypothetical protein
MKELIGNTRQPFVKMLKNTKKKPIIQFTFE